MPARPDVNTMRESKAPLRIFSNGQADSSLIICLGPHLNLSALEESWHDFPRMPEDVVLSIFS